VLKTERMKTFIPFWIFHFHWLPKKECIRSLSFVGALQMAAVQIEKF